MGAEFVGWNLGGEWEARSSARTVSRRGNIGVAISAGVELKCVTTSRRHGEKKGKGGRLRLTGGTEREDNVRPKGGTERE